MSAPLLLPQTTKSLAQTKAHAALVLKTSSQPRLTVVDPVPPLTPDRAQSSGFSRQTVGTGRGTASDSGFLSIYRTESLAWPGTWKRKKKKSWRRMESTSVDRLVGLVVRRPPRERKVPGSNPACAGIFSGSSHTCDLKIGTPVATLPGAWSYRVSAGTGRPSVSIL